MVNQGVSIEIRGIPELKGFLTGKKDDIYNAAVEATKQGLAHVKAEVTQSIAGNRAETRSVDTGHFMGNIYWQQDGLDGTVYTEIEYAPYLEYGTSRGIKPRSHFRNTAAREQDKIVKFYRDEMKKAVEKNRIAGLQAFTNLFK